MSIVYHVVSEFKFEIGQAVLGSQTLQSAVEGVSQAADNTLLSFQRMSLGVAASMGLGTGGVLGIILESIKASEKFGETQRKMANIFLSNQDKIAGGPVSFMEAMSAAGDVMEKVQKQANKFGLPASTLAATTAQIAPALFSSGVAGDNLSTAVTLSRGLLKSAPVLGVDPNMVQGQLLDLVNGRGSAGDTLAMRLMNETSAFKEVGGGKHGAGGSKSPLASFNALSAAKRVDILSRALLQFGSNADVLKANAMSLTNQFQIMKDSLVGMYSILRPIGQVLANFTQEAAVALNKFFKEDGVRIIAHFSSTIKSILGDPKTFIERLMQVSAIKKDVSSVEGVLHSSTIGASIASIANILLKFAGSTVSLPVTLISVVFGAITTFFDAFQRIFPLAGPMIKFAAIFATIAGVLFMFPALVPILGGVAAIMSALFVFFQLLSRAANIAKIADAGQMANIFVKFEQLGNFAIKVFSKIASPFINIFEGIAKWISPLFMVSGLLNFVADSLINIVACLSLFEAVISGVLSSISTFMDYFTSSEMMTNPKGIFGAVGKAYGEEYNRVMKENLDSLNDPTKGAISNQVTNVNGGIHLHNDFKENMQPDRIAFTIVEQFKKISKNPVSSRGGGTFSSIPVGGN